MWHKIQENLCKQQVHANRNLFMTPKFPHMIRKKILINKKKNSGHDHL